MNKRKRMRFLNNEEKEFWKNVAVAVASAGNATNTYNMYEWADSAVEYFRERNIEDKPLKEAFENVKHE